MPAGLVPSSVYAPGDSASDQLKARVQENRLKHCEKYLFEIQSMFAYVIVMGLSNLAGNIKPMDLFFFGYIKIISKSIYKF